jgi:hypothetical protein
MMDISIRQGERFNPGQNFLVNVTTNTIYWVPSQGGGGGPQRLDPGHGKMRIKVDSTSLSLANFNNFLTLDGQTTQKRRLEAKKRIAAGLEWAAWASLTLMKSFKAFVKILFRESLSSQEITLPLACPGF